jgi:hypothetical protein
MVRCEYFISGTSVRAGFVEIKNHEFVAKAAKLYQKEHPAATAAECLAVGRARLKDALVAERAREASNTGKPYNPADGPKVAHPSEMEDSDYLGHMLTTNKLGHPDWTAEQMIREARRAVASTKDERARNRAKRGSRK